MCDTIDSEANILENYLSNIFGIFIVILIYDVEPFYLGVEKLIEHFYLQFQHRDDFIKLFQNRIMFAKLSQPSVTSPCYHHVKQTCKLFCVHLCKYFADIFDKKINFYWFLCLDVSFALWPSVLLLLMCIWIRVNTQLYDVSQKLISFESCSGSFTVSIWNSLVLV